MKCGRTAMEVEIVAIYAYSKPEVVYGSVCMHVRYASELPLFYNQLGLNRMPLMLTTTSGVKRMNINFEYTQYAKGI